jgi:UDP-N-acetylglucosamine 3-dehydrogenase
MRAVRVGVIGTGNMGRQHVKAYARSRFCELVAIADIDGDVAQSVADEFGVGAYHSVEEMLANCELDAVSICTNDEKHVAPTLACLESGLNVLLEKPIATTLEDADTIISAAKSSGKKFMVGQIVRFEPRYALVKSKVDEGELGELETVYARRLNHIGSQDILKGRVSVISFLGVHDFDYLLWLSDSRPTRVYTESIGRIHKAAGHDIEDHTFTLMHFEDGMIACVEAGWVLPNVHPRQADFKLQVIGTKGMTRIDLVSNDIVLGTDKGWVVPRVGQMLDLEIDHFLDCIVNDREPLVSGEEGREALRICLAAQESARTESVIDL